MAAAQSVMHPDDVDNDELIELHIVFPPDWPDPGDARITKHGFPVWIVIDALAATDQDVARVAHDHEMAEDAVQAAVAFYERHRDAIDVRAKANAAAFGAYVG